jgi:hypothetical protein
MNLKKTALCAAMTTVMGISASTASADMIGLNFNGWFTMINASGAGNLVNGDAPGGPMYGMRTPVSGTMSFDTATGAGSAVMGGFSFFGSGLASASAITFQAIGNGMGGGGGLVLGNMGFSWNGTVGIPTSIVLDASGFFAAVGGGLTTGSTIGTGCTGCVDAWSENFKFDFGSLGTYTLPMGSVPIGTTSWNTTDIGTVAVGTNPSGTLPLIADTIGGSPMKAGPFPGFNANFDITSVTITSYVTSAVPVPAAVWLFGSGLLGLAGVARRKKA